MNTPKKIVLTYTDKTGDLPLRRSTELSGEVVGHKIERNEKGEVETVSIYANSESKRETFLVILPQSEITIHILN